MNAEDGRIADAYPAHKIQPLHLSVLAHVLLQTCSSRFFPVARKLFLAASRMQDEMATTALIDTALRYPYSTFLAKPEFRLPRLHLEMMAASESPAALCLHARVLELEGGNDRKALSMLENAVTTGGEKQEDEGLKAILGEAWCAIARIQKKLGMEKQALEAMKTAALEYDQPSAYFALAKQSKQMGKEEGKHDEWLIKAAISGVAEAAFEVGKEYLQRLESSLERREDPAQGLTAISTKAPQIYRMIRQQALKFLQEPEHVQSLFTPFADTARMYAVIREWFLLALQNSGPNHCNGARVYIAWLLSREGNFEGAQTWLEQFAEIASASTSEKTRLLHFARECRPMRMSSTEFVERLGSILAYRPLRKAS